MTETLKFRCCNCNTAEDSDTKMPDLLADVGRGKVVKVGDEVEVICWNCGTTQVHILERS